MFCFSRSVIIYYIYIESYYRQLSADIKMKNYRIKTIVFSLKRPKALAKKTGINFMVFFIFVFNFWLRSSFNLADSNRFRNHSGNDFMQLKHRKNVMLLFLGKRVPFFFMKLIEELLLSEEKYLRSFWINLFLAFNESLFMELYDTF